MADKLKDQDALTEEEAAKRRDKVLRRMLDTPPQPRTAKTTKKRSLGKPSQAKRETGGGNVQA